VCVPHTASKTKTNTCEVGACGVGEGFLVLIYLKDTVVLAMLTLARAAIEKESALAAREGGVPEPFLLFYLIFIFALPAIEGDIPEASGKFSTVSASITMKTNRFFSPIFFPKKNSFYSVLIV
jgi:hypothetical protein